MTCNVPITLPSEILNSVKDSRSTSGFRAWPEHSTSSRLGNPRNSRTVRPEIKMGGRGGGGEEEGEEAFE